jgi:hypothetical protein
MARQACTVAASQAVRREPFTLLLDDCKTTDGMCNSVTSTQINNMLTETVAATVAAQHAAWQLGIKP